MLVGICGGSCSGKTALVKELQAKLLDKIAVVSFDDYFLGADKLDYEKVTDWESPNLYDYEKFIDDLSRLKQGQEIRFESHSRESDDEGIKEKTVPPKALTIVEGFLIYYHPVARSFFDKRIFIELPEDEILKRRIARRKGNKHWDNSQYLKTKFLESQRKFVFPQKKYADLVMDGNEPVGVLVEKIEQELGRIKELDFLLDL
ncbi:MAG TPA: AAA family ATPase [Patescibacteria group bacterium]|nr:AAA family ATPase [Patescibacteria group bacterium]